MATTPMLKRPSLNRVGVSRATPTLIVTTVSAMISCHCQMDRQRLSPK